MTITLTSSYTTTVGKQQAENQNTVILPSNRSSSFPFPIRARKDPSSPAKFLLPNLSLKPMEMLRRSSTPMPLALENTPNYNSPTVVGCAGSKPLTITWNREEWPLSLLGNATSTSFTTCIARGKAVSTFERVQYRYLGQRNSGARPNSVRDDDTHRFEQLKVALKTIGLSKQHIAQTCQLIAMILHLGNLEFTIDRSRDIDAAVVRNTDTLALVADFLGVQPSALENALSYKMHRVSGSRRSIRQPR